MNNDDIDYDIQQAKIILNNFRNKLSRTKVALTSINNICNNIQSEIFEYTNIVRHSHSAHLHKYCHKYNQFGNTNKQIHFLPSYIKYKDPNNKILKDVKEKYIPPRNFTDLQKKPWLSQLLYQEYISNRDLDDNGLIFGRQFIICDHDNSPSSINLLVRSIPRTERDQLEKIKYEDYLETLPLSSEYRNRYKPIIRPIV